MIITTDMKAHHFIPVSEEIQWSTKVPTTPIASSLEYRIQTINNATQFTFPQNHYPSRIEDIFIEHANSKLIMSNRPIYNNGIEDRSLYTYDISTRTIFFKKPLNGSYKVRWLDFSKSNPYQGDWRKLPISSSLAYVNKVLYQGFAKTGDEVDPPASIIDQPGTFQGGIRCFLEINTMPLYGVVCLSDDMKSFLYRGVYSATNNKDTFQFRLYNYYGQESDPYCYKISITN